MSLRDGCEAGVFFVEVEADGLFAEEAWPTSFAVADLPFDVEPSFLSLESGASVESPCGKLTGANGEVSLAGFFVFDDDPLLAD